jgi:SAM-dependent methyltransferase
MVDVQQKWDAIYSKRQEEKPGVSTVLEQNQHLLPKTGLALDLACGLGGNTLFLAEKGLKVDSWDISSVAIEQLKINAGKVSLDIHAQQRDVIADPPAQAVYDVIVVSHFLVRDMAPVIVDALKSGGLLFYQTFCRNKVNEIGPNNPDFLLDDNELLRMFSTLNVRVYREESVLGQLESGWRDQAMLVAEKA